MEYFLSLRARAFLMLLAFCGFGYAQTEIEQPTGPQPRAIADGAKAARVAMYRYLKSEDYKAGKISDGDWRHLDRAAGQIVTDLRNTYQFTPLGNIWQQQYNATVQAIKSNPAAHISELRQAQSEVAAQWVEVQKTDLQMKADIDKERAERAAAPTPLPQQHVSVPGATVPPRVPQTTPPKFKVPVERPPVQDHLPTPPPFPIGKLVLLVALFGAELFAYVVFRARHQSPASPSYSDLNPLLKTLPPRQPSAPLSPPPTQTPNVPGSFKDRIFAEQKEKYQDRYNAVSDELTSAEIELSQRQGVIDGIQSNLKALSRAVNERVRAMVLMQNLDLGNLLKATVTLEPVRRLWKPAGTGLKLILGAVMVLFPVRLLGLLVTGHTYDAAVEFGLAFQFFLIVELVRRLKGPIAACSKYSAKLGDLSLAFVYDQDTTGSLSDDGKYPLVRVMSAGKNPPMEEFPVSAKSWNSNVRRGSFLLYAADMAVYRLDQNANGSLIFVNPNDDTTNMFCSLATKALGEQKKFFASTFTPLTDLSKTVWRRHLAAEEKPAVEQLMQSVGRMESVWRNVYVEEKVFTALERWIDLFNMLDSATPPGILLSGGEGNGKAFLAKRIADSLSAALEPINAATLTSVKEVQSVWQRSRGKNPVVLFVDSAERVFPKAGSENQGSGTREATLAWLTEWQRMDPRDSRVWVIMTTQSMDGIDPQILSCFGVSKIQISAPDKAGRATVLRSACVENRMPAEFPDTLPDRTQGAKIKQLHLIVKYAKTLSMPHAPSEEQWEQAVREVLGGGGRPPKNKNKTWENLILPDEIKAQIKRACRGLSQAEAYKEMKLKLPAILLAGPSGTGKTEVGRTIANELGVWFTEVGTSELKGQYIGQTAPLVRKVFADARESAPAVLFIDEFESLVGKRDSGDTDQFQKDAVTTINREMDGIGSSDKPLLVVAATNHSEMIDPAILSRFTVINIELPDEDARYQIVKKEIQAQGKNFESSFDIERIARKIAKETPKKSGRNLRDVVAQALFKSMDRVDNPLDSVLTEADLEGEIGIKAPVKMPDNVEEIWSKIVLKPEIKAALIQRVNAFRRADKNMPTGLLLYGPPGTGKSEIAKLIKESTGAEMMELQGSSLKKKYRGEGMEEVKKVWERARARTPCIMFIDECNSVLKRTDDMDADPLVQEVVEEFKAQWQPADIRGQIWVVGATNLTDPKAQIDAAIISRFGDPIKIDKPGEAERREILLIEVRKAGKEWTVPDFVAKETAGCSGRDLSGLIANLCTTLGEDPGPPPERIWKDAVDKLGASGPAVDPNARWNTLVVSEETLSTLQLTCAMLKNYEDLREQEIEIPAGILLYGPPGTGKTRIAETLANESGLGFISAGLPDIKGKFLGEAPLKVKSLFARAREEAPCILFIDEIDGATSQMGSGDQFNSDIINTLKTELAGIGSKGSALVFLLAAANNRDSIDSAILSRFTEQILIPNPDREQRVRILKILVAKQKKDFDPDVVCAEVAAQMGDSTSGRDLKMLVQRASNYALKRALQTGTTKNVVLKGEDLFSALKEKRA